VSRHMPIALQNFARSGARVVSPGALQTRLLRMDPLARQVDRILDSSRFPNLTLLFIGSNDTNWPKFLSSPSEARKIQPGTPASRKLAEEIAGRVKAEMRKQLQRLADRAKEELKKNPNERYAIALY